MSIANYRKPKLSNPYSPIYSPISIHSVKNIDVHKNARSVSFYNPKRCISNSYVKNRSLSVTNFEHSPGPNENASSSGQSLNTSNSTSIFNIVQAAGKTLFGHHNDTSKLKRHSERGYLFITNKQRKLDLENGEEGCTDTTPTVTLKRSGTSLFFSRDPFGWDKWETTEFGKDSNTDSAPSNYGTTFIKRRKLFNRSSNSPGDNLRLIKRGYSKEVSYLRQIYNGEYQIPKIIADEKENQLRLINEDKKLSQEWLETELKKQNRFNQKSEHSFKKSIIDLTERIKHVLLNHQPSNKTDKVDIKNENNSDDLIFIKERKYKQESLQRKREKYLEESKRFREELLRLQNEFKNYRQLLEERKQIQNNIKKKREEEEAKKQREQHVLIPNISDKDLSVFKTTLQRRDNAILFNKDNIEVTIRDFKTLAPRRWLNDTIIEFFMKYIEWNTPQTVAFNSFFYSNLSQRGYQAVRRWMKRKKVEIKNLKKIFAPINLNESHWALGFIDIERKRIIYVDSLSQGPTPMSLTILNYLKTYVIEESKNSMGEDFELVHGDCPQQPNGFDCGIYVCMNALYLSKGSELTFTSKDAVNMRSYIGQLILQG